MISEKINEVIENMCDRIKKDSEEATDGRELAEEVKALAELLSARSQCY